MPMRTTDPRTGTPVIDADGLEIGIVSAIEDHEVWIDPDPSLGDEIRSVIGFGRIEPDHVPLPDDLIESVEEGTVRLSIPRRLL
jgi:hypothetical protein